LVCLFFHGKLGNRYSRWDSSSPSLISCNEFTIFQNFAMCTMLSDAGSDIHVKSWLNDASLVFGQNIFCLQPKKMHSLYLERRTWNWIECLFQVTLCHTESKIWQPMLNTLQ
jgi:hypothetical protein